MDRPAALLSATALPRTRQLWLNVTASGGARAMSFACSLLQVAVLTRLLGEEGFGLWVTLLAVGGFITFFDFGVGIGLETSLAEARAQDDPARMRSVLRSGMTTLAMLGAIYLVVGALLSVTVDWAAVLKLRDPAYAGSASAAFALVTAGFAVGVPLNAVPRLAGALQLGRLQSVWFSTGTVVALGIAWLAAKMRWPWLALAGVLSVIPLVQNAGLLVHLWRRMKWPRQWPASLPPAEWRAILRGSAQLSVPQLGTAVMQTFPPLVIASSGGPAAATAFNLIQRFATPLTQALGLMLTPLWPTYVEAQTKGDARWLRRMFFLTLGAAAAGMLGLAVLVNLRASLLPVWVGPQVAIPPRMLAWLTAAWFAVNLGGQPLYYFLLGIRQWRTLARAAAMGYGVGLVAMFVFARAAGPTGALAGALLGVGGLWLPLLSWAAWRAWPRDAVVKSIP